MDIQPGIRTDLENEAYHGITDWWSSMGRALGVGS